MPIRLDVLQDVATATLTTSILPTPSSSSDSTSAVPLLQWLGAALTAGRQRCADFNSDQHQ